MNYNKLSNDEALDILKNEYNVRQIQEHWNNNNIVSAPDVLYYADAYGDLDDAVQLQAWDKSLPERVHRGLLDSGLDIMEAVNCHNLEAERCPCCDEDIYEFEIREPGGHISRHHISDMGDIGDYITYVSDPGGRIWNPSPESDHAPCLCPACSMDIGREFRNRGVYVHYGEEDEMSAFSVSGNLVRWDFMSRIGCRNNANWTDLYGVPGGGKTIAEAFATGNKTEYFEKVGWSKITPNDVDGFFNHIAHKSYRVRNRFTDVMELFREESRGECPYIVDFTTFRTPTMWIPEQHKSKMVDLLVERIEIAMQ
jgi:hypothetical protein